MGFTQPVTEMSPQRYISVVKLGRRERPTSPPSAIRLSRRCEILDTSQPFGILNILQPYGPPRPVTGIALLFYFYLAVNRPPRHVTGITLLFALLYLSWTSLEHLISSMGSWIVGSGVFTAMAVRSYVFWDVTPCSQLKANRPYS
jgi:hypothetical protein